MPIIGDLLAMVRLLRDREAARWAKALVVAVLAYVIFPLDALPDLAPYVGWLDDAGLILAIRVLFYRQLNPYRYPLGGEPPPRPTLKVKTAAEPAIPIE